MTPLTPEQRQKLGRLHKRASTVHWVGDKYVHNEDAVSFFLDATKNALPALLASAERESRLEKALQAIESLNAGGPHSSAEAGLKSVGLTLTKARHIARAALNGETGE